MGNSEGNLMMKYAVVVLFALLVTAWSQKPDKPDKPDKTDGKDVCEQMDNSFDRILCVNNKAMEEKEKRKKEEAEKDSTFNLKKEEDVELFEGDIVYTPRLRTDLTAMQIANEEGITTYDAATRGKWRKVGNEVIVPYTFAPGFKYQGVVRQAIADYNAKTCIRLVPYTRANAAKAGGHIHFVHKGGCYSQIGRVGGRQEVSLGNGCNYKGTAIHEIMHALGFYHEQSRLDRDQYISIIWNRINRRMWYNFKKYRVGEAVTHGEPYDKQSIMHYGNRAFSTDGQMTIISKSNRNERLGSQFGSGGMSRIDRNQLNKHYRCGGTTKVTKRPITANCNNAQPFCSLLSKWCTNSWVSTNCKKTCKRCPRPTTRPVVRCTDSNRNCRSWARAGYCLRGYVAWMAKNCKKSCRKC